MTAVLTQNGHATMERTAPVSIFDDADVFTKYRVEIAFTDKVIGGIPQKPEIIESWLRTRLMGGDEELRLQLLNTLDEIGIEVDATATRDEIIEAASKIAATRQGNTFLRDVRGLCLADYNVKAMLKESTAILYPYQEGHKWGATKKSAKGAVAEWLFVDEKRIPLGRMEPDGIHTQIGHVTGPKGPRSTLTYYDYCQESTCAFTVSSLENRVSHEQWVRILTCGQKQGLGSLRSLSHGQFVVTAFDRV